MNFILLLDLIKDILCILMARGFSADNIAFGMGGGLLQKVDRDTLEFAMKASAIRMEDGEWLDVYKDPIDQPSKKSKRGRLALISYGELQTVREEALPLLHPNQLVTVYRNGVMFNKSTFAEIRERANVTVEVER